MLFHLISFLVFTWLENINNHIQENDVDEEDKKKEDDKILEHE